MSRARIRKVNNIQKIGENRDCPKQHDGFQLPAYWPEKIVGFFAQGKIKYFFGGTTELILLLGLFHYVYIRSTYPTNPEGPHHRPQTLITKHSNPKKPTTIPLRPGLHWS